MRVESTNLRPHMIQLFPVCLRVPDGTTVTTQCFHVFPMFLPQFPVFRTGKRGVLGPEKAGITKGTLVPFFVPLGYLTYIIRADSFMVLTIRIFRLQRSCIHFSQGLATKIRKVPRQRYRQTEQQVLNGLPMQLIPRPEY